MKEWYSQSLPWPSPPPRYAAGKTVRVGDVVNWDQRWRPLQTSNTLDTHQATFRVLAPGLTPLISQSVWNYPSGVMRIFPWHEKGKISASEAVFVSSVKGYGAPRRCSGAPRDHLSLFKWLPMKRHASWAQLLSRGWFILLTSTIQWKTVGFKLHVHFRLLEKKYAIKCLRIY